MSDKLRFGEILVRANVLERGALDRVLQEVEGQPVDLGEVLVTRQHVDEETMLQTISKALNLPGINLDRVQPDQRALSLVPRELCVEHFLLPVEVERSRTGEHLHVAMANPSDVKAIKRVTRQARLRIRPLVASARAIRAAIQRHYGGPPVPGPEPVPASAPAPQAGPQTTAGGGNASAAHASLGGSSGDASTDMFDFGVTDLSALADDGPTAAGPSLEPGPGFDDGGLGDDLFEHDGGAFGARPPAPPPNNAAQASAPPPPQLGADLMSLLDSSATQSVVGQGDLAPPPTPSTPPSSRRGFGMVKRPPRPPHPEPPSGRPPPVGPTQSVGPTTSGGLPPLPRGPAPSAQSKRPKPLPPLPPSLRARTASAPPEPPALDPFATPTPASATAARDPSAPLPPPVRDSPPLAAEPPTPPGVVDDLDERLDLRGLLERFVDDLDESDAQADEVIARYLDRYGQATTPPAGDEFFAALDRTLGHTRSGMGRLIVGLVRQLARRGLVDPDELLADLRDA